MFNKDFRKFVKKKREFYKTIRPFYCPVLKETVFFNSKGFYHLRYDGTGRARTVSEQKYKMGLLPLAVPVIKNAKKIEKFEQRYSKKLKKNEEIWVLKEIVGKQNTIVKVILRRIGNGKITFFSIMKKRDRPKYHQKDRLF